VPIFAQAGWAAGNLLADTLLHNPQMFTTYDRSDGGFSLPLGAMKRRTR
jgi:hypothetical protein